ncbi:nuclear factor NF-kappa-B p110 subunit-like isoform X2 [Teleopsis dalmanni]|nr:nuclear factor NF-kappa-B p110 subunit-like isoform X2 [Teleopsis dalmanni]XP_037952158.1 nuclear factor NF-kappa-B p110 subunit-like isoform X2 [Teleopsis dalmanni]
MSPGPSTILSGNSPNSSVFSSPVQSPATALQTEFSNLNLPSTNYMPLQDSVSQSYALLNYSNFDHLTSVNMLSHQPQHAPLQPQQHIALTMMQTNTPVISPGRMPQNNYIAELKIREEPMEKFRFRYKSEMHGTHGSLNGANSQRSPKTFPEVELCNFNGPAIIRCSLFQTNLDSPHSHQLVVRKDETDACDPHDLKVSPDIGFIAEFQNMGIIHTAKKFIFDELLKKKTNRLLFELGTNDLSTKQAQELRKQTEKEAKEMNLNQVRLCYEAFKIEENKSWTRIAAPIYTKFINNRKSAQTGELRICRLSIASGSVNGGEDIILLVEKVSKKNIKVRFYEVDEDDEVIWEDYAKFRESDVHHQYAITCQIPPYKDKNIEKPVDVLIELLRPSDDERSSPPVTFRYKPREAITSRKRKRTGTSSSGSSLSSFEVPKTVQEQTANLMPGITTNMYTPSMTPFTRNGNLTISEEYNKETEIQKILGEDLTKCIDLNSEELKKICPRNLSEMMNDYDFSFDDLNKLQTDGGGSSPPSSNNSFINSKQKSNIYSALLATNVQNNPYLQQIFKIFDEVRNLTKNDKVLKAHWGKKVEKIFTEHAERNELGDTLLHEVIVNDNPKVAFKTCHILSYFELTNLFNICNMNNESPLHCACILNKPHYIRPMLALGCNPNTQDRNSNTALHIAAQENYDNCVESFLNVSGGSKPPSVRIRNDNGVTALHLAIRENNVNIVKKLLLLDKFAALEPNSKDGNNALHMAVLQQNITMVKLIIKELNVNEIIVTRNAAGLTAIDLSRNIDSVVGKDIFMYLSQLCKETNSPVTIKEEDISSTSSTEEDEEETRSSISSVKIKYESNTEECENKSDAEENLQLEDLERFKEIQKRERHAQILKDIIEDKVNYELLLKILNESNNWKELAHKSQIGHLTFLWRSAADMLNYVKTKDDGTLYQQLATALYHFNKKTTELFETIQPI